MSEGQVLKPEKDFSKETDKVIPEAQELAKVLPGTSAALLQLTATARATSKVPSRSYWYWRSRLAKYAHVNYSSAPATAYMQ